MPSSITHAYIGLDTIKKLNDEPKKILINNVNNFNIYCQGMDILFFYRIYLLKSNKIQTLGHTFHKEKVFDSFKYLISKNKENKDLELFTYISGLICHYKADSTMHPYINFLATSKNRLLHIDKHFIIETYLDNYYLSINEKEDYRKINTGKLFFNYTKKDIIKETLNGLFEELYGYKNIGKKYYRALKEMQLAYKYFRYDPHRIKWHFYSFLDLNTLPIRRCKYLSYNFPLDNNEYYLNTNHNEWFYPQKRELKYTSSFLELYTKVTDEASYIINELYEYIFNNKDIDLFKLIGNLSYSNGLPLV